VDVDSQWLVATSRSTSKANKTFDAAAPDHALQTAKPNNGFKQSTLANEN
jgi:hypothetical protein